MERYFGTWMGVMSGMAISPEEIYRICDSKLRQRRTMLAKAEAAVRRAMEAAGSISAPGMSSTGARGSRRSDRTQKAAILLASAEKQREDALKWGEVFKKLDAVFPEKTTNEGFMASLIYGNGMSQQDVCRFCNCTRQTVRRRLDRYVNYCAMIASSYGLIMEVETDGDDQQAGGAEADRRAAGRSQGKR